MRKLARKLTHVLICALDCNHEVASDARRKDNALKIGNVELSIIQRRFRLLDTLVVKYEGIPMWLPALARLRLRRAVRRYLLEIAQAE